MTVALSGLRALDGLLMGFSWTGKAATPWVSSSLTLHYGFKREGWEGAAPVIDGYESPAVPTEAEALVARQALQAWAEMIPVKFVETNDPAKMQICFTAAAAPSGEEAYSFPKTITSPFARKGGTWLESLTSHLKYTEIIFNRAAPSAKNGLLSWTLLHEAGHALGLKHPFTDGLIRGENIWGALESFPRLKAAMDETTHTVMGYNDGTDGAPITRMLPAGPQVGDIQAVQYLYGQNHETRGGDGDVYRLNGSLTPDGLDHTNALNHTKKFTFVCGALWDGGGRHDRIDASDSLDGVVLDLRAWTGAFAAGGNYFSMAGRTFWRIAKGTLIEDAVGSPHADIIAGNAADNVVADGGGSDDVYALGGNDLIVAGRGDDMYDGGSGEDTVSYVALTASVSVDLEKGTAYVAFEADLLRSFEDVEGGSESDFLAGNGARNRLSGSEGDDFIYGGGSGDELSGGGGDDLLFGGRAGDVVDGDAGDDRVYGGAGADQLTGGEGADLFCYLDPHESTGFAPDHITDFTPGVDRLDLSALSYRQLSEFVILEREGGVVMTSRADPGGFAVVFDSLTALHDSDVVWG